MAFVLPNNSVGAQKRTRPAEYNNDINQRAGWTCMQKLLLNWAHQKETLSTSGYFPGQSLYAGTCMPASISRLELLWRVKLPSCIVSTRYQHSVFYRPTNIDTAGKGKGTPATSYLYRMSACNACRERYCCRKYVCLFVQCRYCV